VDAKEALKEIKGGRFRPIYILYGKDRYRIQHFIETLMNKMFTADERSLGVVKFDTAEHALEEAVLEAETMPFFVSRKLVLVQDAVVFAAGGKEGGKLEHRPEKLQQYMEHPSETSVIVVSVRAEKLDERRKLVKLLKERHALIPFAELDAVQLKQWVIKRAGEQGRVFSQDGAELLLMRVGSSMQQLAAEVDKLCLHVGEGGSFGEAEVQLLTAASVEEDVFMLIDAIAELRIERALSMYHELLTRREEPIKIAALIARQFRIMLQIKELETHHYSPQQMAGHLSLHPYAVKLAAEKGKKFSTTQLGKLLAELAELDYKMKTGVIDKTLGLELYLLSLGVRQGA